MSTQSWLLGFTLICLFFMDDGYLGHSLEEEEDGRPAWARGQAQQFHCSAFSFKRLERFGMVTKIPISNFCQAFVAWFDQKFSPRQFVGGVVHIVQGSVFSLWWLFPHQGMSLHVFDKVGQVTEILMGTPHQQLSSQLRCSPRAWEAPKCPSLILPAAGCP